MVVSRREILGLGLKGLAAIAVAASGLETLVACTTWPTERGQVEFTEHYECSSEMETLLKLHRQAILDNKAAIVEEIETVLPEGLQKVSPGEVIDSLTNGYPKTYCGQLTDEEGKTLNAGFVPGKITFDDGYYLTAEVTTALGYLQERNLIADNRIDYAAIAREYSKPERLDILDQVRRILRADLAGTILHEQTHAEWHYSGEDSHHLEPINYETDPFYAYGDAATRVLEELFNDEISSTYEQE